MDAYSVDIGTARSYKPGFHKQFTYCIFFALLLIALYYSIYIVLILTSRIECVGVECAISQKKKNLLKSILRINIIFILILLIIHFPCTISRESRINFNRVSGFHSPLFAFKKKLQNRLIVGCS